MQTFNMFIQSETDSFEIPDNFNRVESMQFSANPETLQTFVITMSNGVLFAEWVRYRIYSN